MAGVRARPGYLEWVRTWSDEALFDSVEAEVHYVDEPDLSAPDIFFVTWGAGVLFVGLKDVLSGRDVSILDVSAIIALVVWVLLGGWMGASGAWFKVPARRWPVTVYAVEVSRPGFDQFVEDTRARAGANERVAS